MTPLMLFAMAWVGGLMLIQAFDLPAVWLLLAFPAALTLFLGWGDRLWARRTATLCLGVSLGALRLVAAEPRITSQHIAAYRNTGVVGVVGVIVADPDRRAQDTRLRLEVEQVLLSDNSVRGVRGRLLVYAPPYASLHYGDRIRVAGRLENPPVYPGFSYREYLKREGIHAMLRCEDEDVALLAQRQGNPVLDLLLRFRQRAHARLLVMLPDDAGALLAGILLGIERGIPEEVATAFAATGTTHIIAISGFNLTIAASVVSTMARCLSRKKAVLYSSLAVIWAYVFLVGAPAAVTRAGVMSSLIVLAQTEGRRVHGPTSLAAAVLALTLWNPYTLWDIGFQLSVGAMLGLIYYVPPITTLATTGIARLLSQDRAERIVSLLSEVLIVTIAVQITTLGIMAMNFEGLSLISPLANLLILPAQPAVMLFGALALGAGLLMPPVGVVVAWVAWVFLKYTLVVVDWTSRIPNATVELGAVSDAVVCGYYGLLFVVTWFFSMPVETRRALWARVKGTPLALHGSVAAAVVLLTAFGLTQPDGRLHVVFLDAGGGDAVLIVTPAGRQILIDGGEDPRSLMSSLGKQLPFWDRSLDMVILTSPDTYRVAGLVPVLERYRVDFVGTSPETGSGAVYERWLALVQQRPADAWGVLAAGASLDLDASVALHVLWPDPAVPGPLVLRLTYGDESVLLPGDLTAVGEEALVGVYGWDLRSSVLQLPRAGEKTCCGHALLQAVAPELAVVTPRSAAPLASVVTARLMDVPLYRIDQYGTVEVILDGREVRVRP